MPPLAKKKSRFIATVAGGVVVLGAVGAGVWWWQTQARMGQLPDGVTLIPESALYTITVRTEAAPWQLVQAAGLFQSQAWLRGPWGPVSPEGIQVGDIDFAKDVLPWIGAQATFTALPITPNTALVSDAAPVAWIIPIPDQARIEPLITTLKQQTSRDYQGVTIYNVPGPVGEVAGQGIALIEKDKKTYLAWSNVAAALEQVIDTAQGKPNLTNLSRYQEAIIATAADRPQAQLYVNLPAYLGQTSPNPSASPSDLAGLAAGLRVENKQVRVHAITWIPEAANRSLVSESKSVNQAQKLPPDTLASFSTSNFSTFWQNAPADWQRNINNGWKQLTGLDIPQEMLPWMNGEFSLAVLPIPQARVNIVGLVLVAETTNRKQAEAALAKMDQRATTEQAWQVSTDATTQITTWKLPPGIPMGQHGWIDPNTLFIALGPNLSQSLVPSPNPPLSQSPLFRSLLPNSGDTQLYVDFYNTFSLSNQSPLIPQLAPAFQESLQPFKGLGITGRVRNSWSQEYDIRLDLN